MNTRSDLTEFAPQPVKNAVSPDKIQKLRVEREITLEIVDAARKFNKVLGKISEDEAYEIVEQLDFKHDLSCDTVFNAVDSSFDKHPEQLYRTDGIVARLQSELASRGYKITNW